MDIMLERLRYAASYMLPEAALDHMTLEQQQDVVTRSLMYQLRVSVFAQRLDEQLVRYPADWWQAFKERFFPAWALRRWPVLETVTAMRLYAWYPDRLIPDERSQFLVVIDSPMDEQATRLRAERGAGE